MFPDNETTAIDVKCVADKAAHRQGYVAQPCRQCLDVSHACRLPPAGGHHSATHGWQKENKSGESDE